MPTSILDIFQVFLSLHVIFYFVNFPDLYGSDEEEGHQMSRRPILRSRKSSIGDDRASSPEYLQSILKRRSSQEDLVRIS